MKTDVHHRRGVVLLLVLSTLTLFLIMGATLLVIATRARTASRSFLAAISQPDASPAIPRAALDEALLLLIRGSLDSTVMAKLTESLLGDMYATGNNTVPFRTETWDAFGISNGNTFLTEIADDGTVTRAAFQGGNGTVDVDNDGDSVNDGVWLSNLLPSITGSRGGALTFRVSYLVLDLDSRINVNTHGGGNAPAGPGSIDGSSIDDVFEGNRWTVMQQGGNATTSNRTTDLRQPPVLGQDIAGRGSSDPYTLRLDRQASRPATLTGAVAQNPFTLAELERVLRPFDRDWSSLPPRLAAILNNLDNTARRAVTTDSWDVAYTTGGAAATGANPVLKFDLNKAVAKDAFAKALFYFITGQANPDDGAQPIIPAAAAANAATAQWCANVAEFRDPISAASTVDIGGFTVTGVKPADLGGVGGAWPGGFESSGDLAGVPEGDSTAIADILNLTNPVPLVSLVTANPFILEAVHVPSRFTATTAVDATRVPGQINVNTCREDVWRAILGDPGATKPVSIMRSPWDIISTGAFTGPGFPSPDIRGLDRGIANRLTAATTVRSNVFAIWITLEVTDAAVTAGSPTCHRLFAIVDRSIPVTYAAGENKNARDIIRLKRFLN